MKKRIQTLPLLIIVLLSINVSAQKGENLSDMYMKGKWTASCPIEVVDQASMQYCGLCSFTLDPANKKRAHIQDVEMNFTQDSIILDKGGEHISVPYKHDPNNHSFAFKLGNEDFSFRVFMDGDNRVLVNKDGRAVVLRKKK
jgi:hypothetical protein